MLYFWMPFLINQGTPPNALFHLFLPFFLLYFFLCSFLYHNFQSTLPFLPFFYFLSLNPLVKAEDTYLEKGSAFAFSNFLIIKYYFL